MMFKTLNKLELPQSDKGHLQNLQQTSYLMMKDWICKLWYIHLVEY